jgi:hypothetical protein
MPIRRLNTSQYLVYSDDGAAIIDLSRDTANYGVRRSTGDTLDDDDIARLIPDDIDEEKDHWELTPEEEAIVRDILVKHPAGTWIVQGANPLEKIKEAGRRIGEKGKEVGKKIGDKAKRGAEKVPVAGPKLVKLFEDLLNASKAGADARKRTQEFLKEQSQKLGPLEKAMKKNAGLIRGLELSIQRGYMKTSDLTDLAALLEKDPDLLGSLQLTDLEDPENAPVVMMLDDFCNMFGIDARRLAMKRASALNDQFAALIRKKGGQFEVLIVSDPNTSDSAQMNAISRTVNFTFNTFNQMSMFIQKLDLKRESGTVYVKK